MMYPGMYGFGAMGGWWMAIWGIFCIAAVVLVVVLIARLVSPPTLQRSTGDEAKHILDARLARGEIDQQEYRDRRALIG